MDGAGYMDTNPQGIDRHMSAAMDCIYGYYNEALDRLPPDLIPSLLNAGFCFGFLDPVSNIIANTVFQELSTNKNKNRKKKRSSLAAAAKKKEGRDMAITKIISESSYKDIPIMATNGIHFIVAPKKSSSGSSVAARSLQGLVAFLTCYFRYLTYRDTLHYLCLSKADLVVAVRLIEEDRASASKPTFNILDLTVKIAIGCAAISAEHLEVAAFVSRSLSLAKHLAMDEVLSSITEDRVGRSTIKRLSKLLSTKSTEEMTDPGKPMQHAIARMQQHGREKEKMEEEKTIVPAGLQICLQRVLLDKMHVLYLDAISCIPKDDLCLRLHHGLLKAGHCYGPCDPVTNIILHTIWYGSLFPAEKRKFEVEMICTKSLARIECHSLHGLVAFIRVQYPTFSAYEAMRYILNNNILDRVTMAKGGCLHQNIDFSKSDAYNAAAHASSHPNPTAVVAFATTVMPVMRKTLHSILEVNQILASSDVLAISKMCSQNFGSKYVMPVALDLSMDASKIIKDNCEKFEAHQRAIIKRVKAALLRYAQKEGHEYELHVICDVNSAIREAGRYNYYLNHRYPFSHINILARCKGSQYADTVPTLFFIECGNNDEDIQSTTFLCCPISEPSNYVGRCFHCEREGIKIIHPPSETYLGCCTEFEDMVRGKNPMSNESLVRRGEHETIRLETLEVEDSFYFDAALDADFATYVNEKAAIARKKQDLGGRVDLSWLKDRLLSDIALARKKI